ncbi:hypothetical protein DXG03_007527, partial [Asterophora parasitica]
RLAVHFDSDVDDTVMPEQTLDYPRLHSARFHDSVPPALVKTAQKFWENVTSLDLASAEFFDSSNDLICILQQCPLLDTLSFSNLRRGSTSNLPIQLPRLTSLYVELEANKHTWIFRQMVVPSLKNLHLFSNATVNLVPVRDMLVSSRCSLIHFDFRASTAAETSEWYIPGLRTLLTACTTVTSARLPILHMKIANGFAKGEFLPSLSHLYLCVHPDAAIASLDLLAKRTEHDEKRDGGEIIRGVVLDCTTDEATFAKSGIDTWRKRDGFEVVGLHIDTHELRSWEIDINEWAKTF